MTEREYWRVKTAIYREENRDKVNAYRRARYAEKRAEILAKRKAYRAANLDRFRAQERSRYLAKKASS